MHVVVVRHGVDAVRRARPRAGFRRRSCRRAWRRAGPRRSASVRKRPRRPSRTRQHFAELVIRNGDRQRRAARRRVLDAAQADVGVAARDRLIDRGERDVDELAASRPSPRAMQLGDLDVEADELRRDRRDRPRRTARRLQGRRPIGGSPEIVPKAWQRPPRSARPSQRAGTSSAQYTRSGHHAGQRASAK